MKKCLVTCIVLALSGLAASASVTTDFLFDGEAKGFNSWQMVTSTTTDWTNARLEVSLSEGAFSYDYSIPDDILEHLELVSQLRPATTGLTPGLGSMIVVDIKTDPQDFVLSWGDTANLGAGDWQIGLLTFTANASGTIWGKSYDRDSAGVGMQFAFDIVNGQITPAELPVISLPVIPDPVVVETPVVTPDPEVTETLVVTPDPEVTETPIVTPDLEVTVTPIVTPDPEVTETLVVTPDPVVDEIPVITPDPEVTETPVVTPDLEVTETLVVTSDPKVDETPVVTPDPEVTETLVVTPDPEVTETPIVTPDPEVTETPIVTPDPVVTETPIVTPDLEVTETPIVTPDPEVTETLVVTPDPEDTFRFGYHPVIEVIDISLHAVIFGDDFIIRLEDESGLIGKIFPEELVWYNTLGSSGGLTTYSLASVGGGEQAAIDIVPEPASAALLLLGVSTLLRRRKMR